jgi:hypothetical protein
MNLDARITALAQAIGADIKALFSGKVDKVAGKVLSANDYTNNEKTQLFGTPGAISSAVASALRQYRGDGGGISGNITLDNTYAGKWVSITATGAVVIMPSVDTMLSGQTVRILNRSGGQITLTAQGTQGIVVNAISYPSITLEKGEYMEFAANTGNVAWYEVAHGWLDNVSILPTLSAFGSQNLYYNAAMRLSSVANIADGWRLDAPGAVGASTGVMTLVPSFLNPDENAQRLVVTGLNISALYRSLTIDPAFPTRVGEGQDAAASVFVKGTAGLGLRIFFQAINASSVVINTINGLVNVLDGTIQRFSLNYANLPAGTVRVQVFYRLYASAVTDGTVDFARPQCQVGPLSGWNEDTRVKVNVLNPAFTGDFSLSRNGLAAAVTATITGDAGYARNLSFKTGNSGRWDWVCNEIPESGSNVGSNLVLIARSDAGAYLRTPIQVDRATGLTTLGGLAVSAAANFNDAVAVAGNLSVSRGAGNPTIILNGVSGSQRALYLTTSGSERWRIGGSTTAESGSNAGTDFFISRYSDAGSGLSTPLSISRSTGETTLAALTVNGAMTTNGPLRLGQYTLSTRPSAAAYNGSELDATDAPGGPQRQRSNGISWLPLNVGGWVNFTLNAGATANTTHPPQYRMVDDSVEFRGKITLTAALAINTAFAFATLPAGFRPSGTTSDAEVLRLPVACATAVATPVQAQVNRLGSCALVPGAALAAGAILDLSSVRFSTAA